MKQFKIAATTLEEYYEKLFYQHSKSEPKHVKAFHRDIKINSSESENIRELGVSQGGTLATMLMTNPKSLYGYDISLKYISPYKHLFEDYASKNNIDFKLFEMSSISAKSNLPVDMLHIDSLHNPSHLAKEIQLHESSVKNCIVFHDTNSNLFSVIQNLISSKIAWRIDEHYTEGNAGHTVIKRI